MIETKILNGLDVIKTIQAGVDKASNLVKVTLGARGRNVVISKAFQTQQGIIFNKPRVTKDGITVVRNIMLADPIENIGAQFVVEASQKTADEVGDGTTTTAILVQAIVREGIKLIQEGQNPITLKREIDKAVEYVVKELARFSTPIGTDFKKLKYIATVASNNDEKLGELINDAYIQVGLNGEVTYEDAKSDSTSISIVDGYSVKTGYLSPYFITNNKGTCELKNPLILFYERPISTMKPLLPILEISLKEQRPLVIFCENLEGEALATLAVNVRDKKLKVCVIRSPYWAERQIDVIGDMCNLTGAEYINKTRGIKLESVQLEHLGEAEKIVVSKDKTLIIGGKSNKEKVKEIIEGIIEKISETQDKEEKEFLKQRISNLNGKTAIIHIGAATDTEVEEIKDRCDDALRATKAAIEEGYVAGGGTAFLKVKFDGIHHTNGLKLIQDILIEPISQISNNAGIVLNGEIKRIIHSSVEIGYNVLSEQVENMIESGIVDPVKVLRISLQNAASTATMILTSDGLLGDTLKQ